MTNRPNITDYVTGTTGFQWFIESITNINYKGKTYHCIAPGFSNDLKLEDRGKLDQKKCWKIALQVFALVVFNVLTLIVLAIREGMRAAMPLAKKTSDDLDVEARDTHDTSGGVVVVGGDGKVDEEVVPVLSGRELLEYMAAQFKASYEVNLRPLVGLSPAEKVDVRTLHKTLMQKLEGDEQFHTEIIPNLFLGGAPPVEKGGSYHPAGGVIPVGVDVKMLMNKSQKAESLSKHMAKEGFLGDGVARDVIADFGLEREHMKEMWYDVAVNAFGRDPKVRNLDRETTSKSHEFAVYGADERSRNEAHFFGGSAADDEAQMIEGIERIQKTLKFIDEALSKGQKVIIYCRQGKDRSVSLVYAYLRYKSGMESRSIIDFIQSRRTIANNFPVETDSERQMYNWYIHPTTFAADDLAGRRTMTRKAYLEETVRKQLEETEATLKAKRAAVVEQRRLTDQYKGDAKRVAGYEKTIARIEGTEIPQLEAKGKALQAKVASFRKDVDD